MPTPLLVLRLRGNADTVRARHHARHLASLLGFTPLEQAGIAAAVFEIARHAREGSRRAALQFQIAAHALQVFPVEVPPSPGPPAADPALDRRDAGRLLTRLASVSPVGTATGLRLDRPLPREQPALAPEDLAWVVQEVARRAAPNLYAEARQQNQETLYLLRELHACREQLARLGREPGDPRAA
jgi:hypothetical protein